MNSIGQSARQLNRDRGRSSGPWSIQPGDHRRQIRLPLRDPRHHPQTGQVPEGIEAQSEQGLRNTIFYADVDDFAKLNEVYSRYVPDPQPARSAPANVKLPRGLLVSIEAMALLPA
jgi:hypothetical protein